MQPVTRTAFYCCALRAEDAASAVPVCGDGFAEHFMDERTRAELQPLLRVAGPAAGNVARHRLIDDLLRAALSDDPARRVFIVGAGFDTRAFRLRGGHWWEFDDPALLAFKEERLPAGSAPNPLVRVPVDFRQEHLAAKLRPLAGNDAAMVVVEGVSMYLPSVALTELAEAVRGSLPRARLICDLMSPAFARRFSARLHRELRRMGTSFAPRTSHPRLAIEAAGYRALEMASVVGRAREAGTVRIPAWVLNTVLRELRDGYAVWTFEAAGETPLGRTAGTA